MWQLCCIVTYISVIALMQLTVSKFIKHPPIKKLNSWDNQKLLALDDPIGAFTKHNLQGHAQGLSWITNTISGQYWTKNSLISAKKQTGISAVLSSDTFFNCSKQVQEKIFHLHIHVYLFKKDGGEIKARYYMCTS